ncbi:hypothetical protein [Mycobacterium sp. 852002-10029_SCH5224772]|uniref:hypothetical protein n=1 Tax=Mycobacterium sp. 852002-10029_SCH5224772 TaxID=1834083 RepID=UPI00080239C0|nr:hypothetical protein [Mycobacterium sp. 852002-10029_SCH5224772]OBE96324.1 hypothetical protein A5775_10700 [Mycobacterium sp. 852002-10029_SCH5224772]
MIEHAMLKSRARKYSGALDNFLPVEADPADWAEQQLSVSLPDDEYPYVGGDRRVLITTSGGLDID